MAANLEINPKHPVVIRLKEMVSAGEESGDEPPVATGFAELLYDVAAVSSGYELKDAPAFAKRVVALMSNGETALSELALNAMSAGDAPPAAETSAVDDKDEEAAAEPAEAP